MKRPTGRWILLSGLAWATSFPSSAQTPESVRELLKEANQEARQGQHGEAVETLRKALEVAPNSEDVLRAFAKNSLAARDPMQAIRALEPLTRMHPQVAEYPYLLGVAHLQVGATDRAVASLRRARELEPQRPLTLTAIGLAYNAQKRFGEAAEILTRSLEIEPNEVETLAALAEAEEGRGRVAAAEHHAQRALHLAGEHAGAYFTLGKIRMSQQRFEEAKEFFQRAAELDPGAAKVHYQLSLAYARLNDPENSKKHRELYREAQELAERRLIELRTKAGSGVGNAKL